MEADHLKDHTPPALQDLELLKEQPTNVVIDVPSNLPSNQKQLVRERDEMQDQQESR